jgi:hypothetical protein
MRTAKTTAVIVAVLLGSASARTWYVHPDSTQDSIQPCINACGVGDTVLVAAGTYHEKLVWPNTQGIKLWSESGPDSTVIDGDSSGTVITIDGTFDTTTAVEGFTVTRGYSSDLAGGMVIWYAGPMIRNNTLSRNVGRIGGAIMGSTNDSIQIVNNRFIHNHATTAHGAVGLGYGTAIVTGNLFEQNLAETTSGAVGLEDEDGLLKGNVFRGNRAGFWAGALNCIGPTGRIEGNTFTDDTAGNTAGGMYFTRTGSSPIVIGNSIRRCRARAASAVVCFGGKQTFINDTIVDNETQSIWGVFHTALGATPHVSHCLFAGNTTLASYGAVTTQDSSAPTIDSCSIVANNGEGVYVGTGSHPTISYCNIYGNRGYGIDCGYYAESVYACNNWWGDSTGPFHPDSNPGGRGDTLSDGVFFKPWLRDSVSLPGVSESYVGTPASLPTQATVVHRVLDFAEAAGRKPQAASLLDISGRKVLGLKPGANDVTGLAPGVYFLRSPTGMERGASGATKVIVTR